MATATQTETTIDMVPTPRTAAGLNHDVGLQDRQWVEIEWNRTHGRKSPKFAFLRSTADPRRGRLPRQWLELFSSAWPKSLLIYMPMLAETVDLQF